MHFEVHQHPQAAKRGSKDSCRYGRQQTYFTTWVPCAHNSTILLRWHRPRFGLSRISQHKLSPLDKTYAGSVYTHTAVRGLHLVLFLHALLRVHLCDDRLHKLSELRHMALVAFARQARQVVFAGIPEPACTQSWQWNSLHLVLFVYTLIRVRLYDNRLHILSEVRRILLVAFIFASGPQPA